MSKHGLSDLVSDRHNSHTLEVLRGRKRSKWIFFFATLICYFSGLFFILILFLPSVSFVVSFLPPSLPFISRLLLSLICYSFIFLFVFLPQPPPPPHFSLTWWRNVSFKSKIAIATTSLKWTK